MNKTKKPMEPSRDSRNKVKYKAGFFTENMTIDSKIGRKNIKALIDTGSSLT